MLSIIPLFSYAWNKMETQELQLLSRQIGDSLLKQINDDSSRVLPIEYLEDAFIIKFETEIELNPSDLSIAVNNLLRSNDTYSIKLIETKQCSNSKVAHSFSPLLIDSDIACSERTLPLNCYEIFLHFNRKEKDHSINSVIITLTGFLASLTIFFLVITYRKKQKINEHNIINFSSFKFNMNNMTLTFSESIIQLSSKESELLKVLLSKKNEDVRKEDIMKKVWNDEGSYNGRTLDVYISRLRKKLESDPKVQLKNIRGIGYRLIIE